MRCYALPCAAVRCWSAVSLLCAAMRCRALLCMPLACHGLLCATVLSMVHITAHAHGTRHTAGTRGTRTRHVDSCCECTFDRVAARVASAAYTHAQIVVTHAGKAVPGSPWVVKTSKPEPHAPHCTVRGLGVHLAIAREPSAFEVSFRDQLGALSAAVECARQPAHSVHTPTVPPLSLSLCERLSSSLRNGDLLKICSL